ncbi:MAG: hypothetical protein E7074_00455 [Bacteroidales bacterium]|jgi:uncharacterized repeat protein (TIGR02543 family)|nr:hypothetical protein [Bacteroidales bacterium]
MKTTRRFSANNLLWGTALLALCNFSQSKAQTYWDGTQDTVFIGTGTQSDPFLITSAEELAGLAYRTNVRKEDFTGQYLRLTQDIYLTNFSNPDTANWLEWEPIAHTYMQWGQATDYGYFRGTFDGQNHTVFNMYYGRGMNWADDWDPNDLDLDLSSYDFSVMNKALFVNLDGGTIENLRVANAKMAGVGQALLVLDAGVGSVIRNCHAQGEMRATQSGSNGLVRTNKGLIENCSTSVRTDLQGASAFVGTNDSTGIIRNCTAAGAIRCTMGDGSGFVGGNYGLIERCSSNVQIQALGGPDAGTNAVGGHTFRYRSGAGFVMMNDRGGIIRECSATGDLLAEGSSINYVWASAIAGFAYRNWGSARIESCYCTGALRDVSDSTNVGGDPQMAMFCYNNGEDAGHESDAIERGDIFNCFSTSTVRHHDPQYYQTTIHAFLASRHTPDGGFYPYRVAPSQQVGCYFNVNGLPAITGQSDGTWGGVGKTLAQMQSQAFVDTLNMLAKFLGLSQWQYNAGALPTPTGVYQKDVMMFFAGGDGTKQNPYLISNKTQLENFRWLVNQGVDFRGEYILQTADIALNAPQSQWEEVGPTRWTPIGVPLTHSYFTRTYNNYFAGEYNGGFHEVQNMYINTLQGTQGLFGSVGRGAILRNLGVTGAYVRAERNIGILAGSLPYGAIVIQCWTSGNAAPHDSSSGSVGAIAGTVEGGSHFLNCASSAVLTGGNGRLGNYTDAVYGGYNVWAQDSLVNFLFTGCLNDGGGSFGHFQYRESAFADKTLTKWTTPNATYIGAIMPTEWVQSKDLVNIYNYSVARWNATHNDTLQLNYWEWVDGQYPRISTNASWKPAVTITFQPNGGEAVPAKYIYPGTEALPPQRPAREGYIFAGWYKDAALTQFFRWDKERPESSLTLYARWLTDDRFDIDITPFQNEFAKTYHISTAAQLRGFAAMQNGMYDFGEKEACGNDHKWVGYNSVYFTQTQVPMDFTGKKVVLDNDIFLCDTTDWENWGYGAFGLPWKPIGSYYDIVGEGDHTFKGTFDGQGHVIYGMYMECNGMPGWNSNSGLFGDVGDSAVIRNVGIRASVMDRQNYNTRGQITDAFRYWRRCGYSDDQMGYIGLLAGMVKGNCTIEQCFTEGNILQHGSTEGGRRSAGFIGSAGAYAKTVRISNCYSRVNNYYTSDYDTLITSLPSNYGFAVLENKVHITNCYNAGVSYHSFCNGNNNYADSVVNCYYDKAFVTDLVSTARGYIATPATTNQMHAKTTFSGWDFDTVWGRNDTINDGYPYLRQFRDSTPDSPDAVLVSGITLDTTYVRLIAGHTYQAHATVLPLNAENRKVNWSITVPSNSDAGNDWATVDSTGKVSTRLITDVQYYAGRSGTVILNATTDEGYYTAQCSIVIMQPKLGIQKIAGRRVGENEWDFSSSSTNAVGWEYLIAAYAYPDSALEGSMNWELSNENQYLTLTPLPGDTVLSFKATGYSTVADHTCQLAVITLNQEGKTTIRGSLPNGVHTYDNMSGYAGSLTIQGTYHSATYLSIKKDDGTSFYSASELPVGYTMQLTANVEPKWISYTPVITWTSSDSTILRVSQTGFIEAVGAGTATLTARDTISGKYVNATVTVYEIEVNYISVSPSWMDLGKGQTGQFTVTFNPENATNKTITWTSANPSLVTVDSTGFVTVVGDVTSNTECSITATSANGRTYTASVYVQPTRISIPSSGWDKYFYETQTRRIPYTITPEGIEPGLITWTSANNAYATVDETGLVTAVSCNNRSSQSVRITATLANGNSANVTIYVRQSVRATDVALSPDTIEMRWNESQPLTANFTPAGVTNPQMFWESSDTLVVRVEPDETDVKSAIVYGVAPGWAFITGLSQDGDFAAECLVHILDYGTDLKQTEAIKQPTKIFRDGHIYILLPDGKEYDATGKLVK